MTDRDTIFQHQEVESGSFRFDAQVASVFDDMLARSVPGYELTLELLSVIARLRARDPFLCYDLGCSLGASTLAVLRGLGDATGQVIAIDNSVQMLEAADQAIDDAGLSNRVYLQCSDIRDAPIADADLVVLNFTLQFVPVDGRLDLLQRIYHALKPGGALVLSEKICFESERENDLLNDLHHEFKRQRGYSDLEISRKRSAIENVLVTESAQQHRQRLQAAGFSHVTFWLQCFNFVSILAEK